MLKLNSKKRKFAKSLKADYKGTLKNKLNEGVFFKPKHFQTSYLTGSINQMNKYENKLQSKRIRSGVGKSVDYVYRIKDKHDKGRVKPIWSFS